jgi:nucleoside 2-deoxyribosyltransferase
MIQIAGGAYLEVCLHPHWQELFGSGGRAAAALAGVGEVGLHTYVGDSWRAVFLARAEAYGFKPFLEKSPSTIQFDYVHPLSTPRISPYRANLPKLSSLKASGDVVLRFGMLECDAIVDGDRIVYDPQSAHDPRPFRQNGSSANHLSIVANADEAKLLTGKSDPKDAAAALRDDERAEVVIVKRGVHGALVLTAEGMNEIKPFHRDQVFTIGSGDVFAAAFTQFWGREQRSPMEAAELASRATALYCESRSLPLQSAEGLRATTLRAARFKPGRVYLAAPFFDLAQRWLLEEARTHLTAVGLDVFSPLHDVGTGSAECVAPADLAGIDHCDRMLALIDGADVGTVFEVGYASARGMPVVALAETLSVESLKMIAGSGCILTKDFASAIFRTAWLECCHRPDRVPFSAESPEPGDHPGVKVAVGGFRVEAGG